jgi:hypothetical protein
MKGRETLTTVAALGAIAIASVLAYRYEHKPNRMACNICNRMTHAGMSYNVDVGGHTEFACCPRCGMHYQMQHSGEIKRAWATDIDSGELVPAARAYYDEGGDIQYCTHDAQPLQRGPQGVSVRGFDRCLPTLVAFKTRAEAENYQKVHGGRLLNYDQAMESVSKQ